VTHIRVQRDELKRTSAGFAEGSIRLAGILEKLRMTLEAEGRCWGTDETGRSFEQNHAPVRDEVLRRFSEFATDLSEIRNGLNRMADRHTAAEDATGGV
jgi:hypothetical protein